ncbi:helix-turn-helix domain-containing protein [Streptococcus pluranimalium]
MKLGDKIKRVRLDLGETMEQFGKRFNTGKGTVNNWEKGRNAPNRGNMLEIAKLANKIVDEFLTI